VILRCLVTETSNVIETLEQEKAKPMAAGEAEVTTVHTRFQYYRVHHRKKIHEFCANLEAAVNEMGVRCLSYPRRNSSIAKANKNFLCYCIASPQDVVREYKLWSY
jgi:hypothetical protein